MIILMKSKIILLLFGLGFVWFMIYHYATNIDVFTLDTNKPGPTVLMIGGTHGNEPAGTVWIEYFMKHHPMITRGKIIMVPRLNKLGLLLNQRYVFHNINTDLNRNYPIKDGEEGKDMINKEMVRLIEHADFIIDFHEGWGFNRIDKISMSSGLYPSGTNKSVKIGNELLKGINQTIKDSKKHFIIDYIENSDLTLNTLRNHANYKKKNYILVETSGQNDIQPLELRVNQNKYITMFILSKLKML